MGFGFDDIASGLANTGSLGLYQAGKAAAGGYASQGNGGHTPGDNIRDAQAWAKKGFNDIYGRDPNADELAQILPAYIGSDPHITDVATGNSLVAQMHQASQNTPLAQQQKQQAQWQAQAPQFHDQINQVFQQTLGRAPTADELNHFSTLAASGQVDPYGIGQQLQQSTEYRNAADTKFRGNLQNQLQGTQSDYYNKYILPGIQSQFAQQGRSVDSSGFQQAAVQAGKQQNYDLQNYLAGVSADQYGGNVNNAAQNYQGYANQLYGNQNFNRDAMQSNFQAQQSRQQELQNYNLQRQAYNNYLSRYGKRNNGLGAAIGGAVGGGIGAYFGGAAGASAGYGIGSGLGNYGQQAYSGGYI